MEGGHEEQGWGGGDREGDNGEGKIGRGQWGEGGGQRGVGQQGGGDGEGEMERGATGKGRWGGEQRGGGDGEGGERRGQAHRMPGWNEVTVFSDFVNPCNARVPQQVYTNKIGDCLFICSPMDGQTARPNGLKFGG